MHEYIKQITSHLKTIQSSCSTKPTFYAPPIFKNLSNPDANASARISFSVETREFPRSFPRITSSKDDERRWNLICSMDEFVTQLKQFVDDQDIPVDVHWVGMTSKGMGIRAEIEVVQHLSLKEAMMMIKRDPASISMTEVEELERVVQKYDVVPNDDAVASCCVDEINEFLNRVSATEV